MVFEKQSWNVILTNSLLQKKTLIKRFFHNALKFSQSYVLSTFSTQISDSAKKIIRIYLDETFLLKKLVCICIIVIYSSVSFEMNCLTMKYLSEFLCFECLKSIHSFFRCFCGTFDEKNLLLKCLYKDYRQKLYSFLAYQPDYMKKHRIFMRIVLSFPFAI